MSPKRKQIITMITGVAVALAIICSQLFYFQNTTLQKKETKTEKHQQENSDDQVYFSVPSTSLPSPVHVELNPSVFFLFEILLEDGITNTPDPAIAIPSGQFFRTIFGLIISPNAP